MRNSTLLGRSPKNVMDKGRVYWRQNLPNREDLLAWYSGMLQEATVRSPVLECISLIALCKGEIFLPHPVDCLESL